MGLWVEKGSHTKPDKLREDRTAGLINPETKSNHTGGLNMKFLKAGHGGKSHPRPTAFLSKVSLYL